MRHVPRLLQLLPLWLGLNLAPRPVDADDHPIANGLRPFVDKGSLAGAVVLVAGPEKTLDVEAVGYADIAANTPMRTDDLFWIASMSKPMTAAALMMLVDEGKVKLDDPVSAYLPEFGREMEVKEGKGLVKARRPITVRDVLSHTSGLVTKSPREHELDMLPLKDVVASVAGEPLRFQPGTKYEYCNSGINTAGRVVEVVSGMPYETFLQTRLFDPLGMKDTTFWPTDGQLKRLAKSYKPVGKGLEEVPITQLTYPLTDHATRHPYPAGGLFSTAGDVAQFGRMVLNGGTLDGKRYVSESAVRAMTSTQTGTLLNNGKGEHGYGLGFSTARQARGDAVIPGPCGHGGAYATDLAIDPARKTVVVFMVQHAGFAGSEKDKIMREMHKGVDSVVRASAPGR